MTAIEKFRLAAESYLHGVFTGMGLLGGGEGQYLDDDDGLADFAEKFLGVPQAPAREAYEAAFEAWIEGNEERELVDLYIEALEAAGFLPVESP